MFRTLHEGNHRKIAHGLLSVGKVLLKVDKLQQSLQYCKEALEMRRALPKEDK